MISFAARNSQFENASRKMYGNIHETYPKINYYKIKICRKFAFKTVYGFSAIYIVYMKKNF